MALSFSCAYYGESEYFFRIKVVAIVENYVSLELETVFDNKKMSIHEAPYERLITTHCLDNVVQYYNIGQRD